MKMIPRKTIVLALVLLGTGPLLSKGDTFVSLKVSTPLLVSVSGGYYFTGPGEPGSLEPRPVVEAELGVGGGKILGGVDTLGDGFGYGIKGGILRTWVEPVGADRDNTYFGFELEGGYERIILALGGYRRIEGDGDGWLATISIGFRL